MVVVFLAILQELYYFIVSKFSVSALFCLSFENRLIFQESDVAPVRYFCIRYIRLYLNRGSFEPVVPAHGYIHDASRLSERRIPCQVSMYREESLEKWCCQKWPNKGRMLSSRARPVIDIADTLNASIRPSPRHTAGRHSCQAYCQVFVAAAAAAAVVAAIHCPRLAS